MTGFGMNELRSILLSALEDFRQIAENLGQPESVLDSKSFYYGLFAQCFQLHRQIIDIKELEPLSDYLEDKLKRLESLVVLSNLQPYLAQEDATSPYPNLGALHRYLTSEDSDQVNRIKILKGCIDFESRDDQSTLIILLKDSNDYLKTRVSEPVVLQEYDSSIPPKARQRPPDGIWPAANLLFKVLDSRRRCSCNPTHEYVVQLCLETHRAKLVEYDFDLYLDLGEGWQEARVQTARVQTATSPKHRMPTIVVDNSIPVVTNTMNKPGCRERRRIVQKLCKDIKKPFPNYRLRLRLEEDSLWKLRSEESSFKIDKSKPPLSLAQIILQKSNVLNEKTKRILSVLLSYAVFHLHGTPWLKSPWGSPNVMFFRSSSGLPMRPYVETPLDDTHTVFPIGRTPMDDDDDFDPDDELSPRYPGLVDLAVVLMELHQAKPLDSLADICGVPVVDETNPAARYIFVREIFKQCRLGITDQTRMAISSCLNPNIGFTDDGEELDEHGLRDVIYQQIVRRLEDELEQGFGDLSVDKLDFLVQSMDLANGGWPIRLEQGTYMPDSSVSPSKEKRRLPDDTTRRRVRFSTIAEPNGLHQQSHLVAPALSTIISEQESKSCYEKGAISASSSCDPQSCNLPGRSQYPRTRINEPGATRPDTIRVLNIRDDVLRNELETELGKLFNATCEVHSLARASRDTHWQKYATVTFPALSNDKLHDLLKADEAKLRGPSNFQYDTTFLGITPLYDAGEEATTE
ncbi:hypothetical protein M426DRAFT_176028 [Hypoxylon sp. CI-4A]|nr:hypothetical protein M426DRAFT_176028 [Hypoxylon sp. CI-4A]